MKNQFRQLAATCAALALCIAPAAISQASPSTNDPAPNAASALLNVAPPVSGDLHYTEPKSEPEIALDYLRSEKRVQRYEDDFEKASVLVASAIDSGYFATTSNRYNDNMEFRQDWYAGPGGITTPDGRTSAWLHWNADGSINYKKGVESFSLSNGHATVTIAKSDLGEGPYLGTLQQGPRGYVRVITPKLDKEPVLLAEQYRLPYDQTALILLDTEVLRALDLMMAATFHTRDWRNLVLR